jgi:hypothetical protein
VHRRLRRQVQQQSESSTGRTSRYLRSEREVDAVCV